MSECTRFKLVNHQREMACSKGYFLKLAIFQQCFLYITLVVLATGTTNTSEDNHLLITRCRSNCTYDKQCYHKCMRNYLENSAYKKYGDCPTNPPSKLDTICLNTCDGLDYKCPGVEKCCAHSCGQSCQSPQNLDKVKGLPPVPVHAMLLDKGVQYRTAEIQWDMKPEQEQPSPTYYIVESRYHIGTSYTDHRMENDWQLHPLTSFMQEDLGNLKRYTCELKLKPGRWYQVRVAAINSMGTRGYSLASKPFQLSKKPNPPQAPKSLIIESLEQNENGTYDCRVSWSLSRSDLPVEKYKLSWSLYLNATNNRSRTDNSSLFKEMATISAPTRYYDIRGLQPNRFYYLQIQAISVYGRKRLKSAANHQLVNTSTVVDKGKAINLDNLLMGDAGYRKPKTYPTLKDGMSTVSNGNGAIRNMGSSSGATMRYHFRIQKSGLAVRLTWSAKGYGRYRVQICRGNRDCLTVARNGGGGSSSSSSVRSYNDYLLWHDVVSRRNTYEFGKLDFDTRYSVGVRIGHRRNPGYDIVRSFVTPKCEHFRDQNQTHTLAMGCSV
ncbi:anosmin-1 isoform X1 [Anopheles darlingi]|uniref:anosmin-1 isoform X1 n=2 Tax=Anopheles darlingi TaxID=43151 RepID=UPI0021005C97|nr:anosmin-1 isoform X1 [Anopheles darlingi]XP_049548541.1 anosmin-1 isoform X1 [Anopheles darlingi]